MTSAIYYHHITDIDCAYINDQGETVGLSFAPEFIIRGELTEDEQVVADFSSAKKKIKAAIDNPVTGIDHKLIIFTNYSKAQLYTSNTEHNIIVETPHVTLDVPLTGIKTVFQSDNETAMAALKREIETICSRELGLDVTVKDMKLNNDPNRFQDNFVRLHFRYTHGLTNSTSYGCKNIMHGHYSYADVNSYKSMPFEVQKRFEAAIKELDGAYIVCSNHVVDITNRDDGTYVSISYQNERGKWSALLKNPKLIVLDNEPTIENILEWVSDTHYDLFTDIGRCTLRISEGLNKGAIKEFE